MLSKESAPTRDSVAKRPWREGMESVEAGSWQVLLDDLHFIQRTQKNHGNYWDRSTLWCQMEEGLGARGVKAGDLHTDSQPSVVPPPQVGTAPYVPIRKGSTTSLILLSSSPTVPHSKGVRLECVLIHTPQDLLWILCWGKGRDGLGVMTRPSCAICPFRAGSEEVWRFYA